MTTWPVHRYVPIGCARFAFVSTWVLLCIGAFHDARATQESSGQGLDARQLAYIEPLVREAIQRREIPGCVILLLHRGSVEYFEAFGNRCLEPTRLPMTRDTVFDLASITKPVATATSVMILVERGKLRL